MKSRILVSSFFAVGAAIAGLVLLALYKFGSAMVGMSDGTVSGDAADKIVPWVVLLYFLGSALGIAIFKGKRELMAVALVMHIDLLALFLIVINVGKGTSQNSMGDLLTGLIVVALFFSPWIFAWILLLSKAEKL